MKRLFARALVAALVACSARAGSYDENFEGYSSGATTLSNGATLSWSVAGVTSVVTNPVKELQFTRADVTDTRAALLLPDLDPGQPIRSFSARWDALVFGNFPNAGAGFSLNLGNLSATNLVGTNGAQDIIGYGTGLVVSVHTGTDFSPGMRLIANGTALITARNLDPGATWGTNSTTRRTFHVFWAEGKGVSVMLDGTMLFTNVPMTNYVPAAGDRLVWAARAGQSTSQTYRIDNVSVHTSTNSADALVLESAAAKSALDRPVVRITARVNTLGLPTTMLVEVGTNTAYGTVVTNALPPSGSATNVTIDIPYTFDRTRALHARVTVSNALHAATSGDLPFESHRFLSTFVQSYSDGEPGAINGATAWLDKDNDGWLDFVITGLQTPYAMIGRFHFNPGANPTNMWPLIDAVAGSRPGIALGDFDNDNRPDAFFAAGMAPILSGPNNASIDGLSGPSFLLYGTDDRAVTFNTNALIFTNHPVMGALAVASDFDRNGQQDLLLIGQKTFFAGSSNDVFAAVNVLFQNTAFGLRLTNTHVGLPYNWAMKERHTVVPCSSDHWMGQGEETKGQSTLAVGDVDGDGFDDVFNLGFGDPQRKEFGLFRGDGDLGFAEAWRYRIQDLPLYRDPNGDDRPFFNMASASSVWADFDGDGSLDLLFTRADGYYPDSGGIVHPRNELWFNDGSGNLTNSGIVLPALAGASVAVGDLFNHGRNDILISGATNVSQSSFFDPADYRTVLLRNEGGGVFTAIQLDTFGVVEMTGRGLALADYDQDGRLDAVMSGFNSKLAHFNVLRNTMDIPSNAPPAAPSGLAVTVGDGTVTFRWSHASDDITPTNLLTYNLRVGTNPLGTEAVSPLANVTTGWRKVAAPGNVAHTTNITYRLPPGVYQWSVQAVDGAFAGGAWAAEQTFTITNAEPVRLNLAAPTTTAPRRLNWPLRHLDFGVEEQSALGGAWTSNSTPATNVNGQFIVPVTNETDAVRFFRLSK